MNSISAIDALLLLMTLIWGTNYSIVKSAFAELDAQAFNAARMILGSLVFLAIIVAIRRMPSRLADGPADSEGIAGIFYNPTPITRRDWLALIGLGLVGHTLYQYFFIGGLARTSVANSSLMLAATPVVIALVSALIGEDRIGRMHWVGAALSMLGIYMVVGRGTAHEQHSLVGDLMMFGAVCCWAVYTIAARRLMRRHSPVGVTGLSMAIGTALYVPLVWRTVRDVDWSSVKVELVPAPTQSGG